MAKNKIYSYNVYNSIPYLFLLVIVPLFMFSVSGCQEEKIEIIPAPPDQVIVPNSTVANLIQRISLNDGSSDNILDNSSCTLLILPVTVLVNGQEIQINSKDDLKFVERIFDEDVNEDDTVIIIFPVTVILADHTSLTINNEEELEAIIDQCTEGGDDDDIECIDFQYPLTFSLFNSNNQLFNTKVINNDQGLYEFLQALEQGDLVSPIFPITVVLSDGTVNTINNNDELEDIIENAIDDCDEDDDNDHNDDDIDDTELIMALIDGEWEITNLFTDIDQTASFMNFVFTFNEDNTGLATDGTSSVNGTWESHGDDGCLELELDFEGDAPFEDIRDTWEVIEFSSSLISLEHMNDENEPVSTLVFEKK